MATTNSEIIEGLNEYTLWRTDSIEQLPDSYIIAEALYENDIAVAMLSDTDLGDRNAQEIVDFVAKYFDSKNDSVKAFIVTVKGEGGTQLYYGSKIAGYQEALNGLLGSKTQDLNSLLMENSTNFKNLESIAYANATEAVTETRETEIPQGGSSDITGTSRVVLIIGVIFILIPQVYKFFTRNKNTPPEIKSSPQDDKIKIHYRDLANSRAALQKSLEFQRKLKDEKKDYCDDMEELVTYFDDLWASVREDDEPVKQEIAIKYAQILGKVAELTSEKYWGDLVLKPHYWNKEENDKRRDEMERMVTNVAEMTLNNIRRHREKQALDYDVSLRLVNDHSAPLEITDGDEHEMLNVDNLLSSMKKPESKYARLRVRKPRIYSR